MTNDQILTRLDQIVPQCTCPYGTTGQHADHCSVTVLQRLRAELSGWVELDVIADNPEELSTPAYYRLKPHSYAEDIASYRSLFTGSKASIITQLFVGEDRGFEFLDDDGLGYELSSLWEGPHLRVHRDCDGAQLFWYQRKGPGELTVELPGELL